MIENSLTTENIPKDLLSIFKKVIKEERISEQEGLTLYKKSPLNILMFSIIAPLTN